MMQGTVKQYFPDRGYGYVAADGGDEFPVRVTQGAAQRAGILGSSNRHCGLVGGMRLEYRVEPHWRSGELQAVDLKLVSDVVEHG